MKIEKLNEDKIRITLNLEDLKENDIDFHAFMSNSIESQELFLDMLDKAEKEVGFITDDYRVMIEALALNNGNFVLTVTRISPEKSKNTFKNKRLTIKRKNSKVDTKKAVYCFESFEEFCSYCSFLKNNKTDISKHLANKLFLYEYQEKYYLVLEDITMEENMLKSFTSSITEFARFMNHSDLFESKLLEYGHIIFPNNAIENCLKHFC